MKILNVIPTMDPRLGGPREFIQQLGGPLEDQGHTCEIACIDSPDDPWVKETSSPIHALGPGAGRYHYSKRFLPWLCANASKYDCALVHGVWCYSSLGTWMASRRTGFPYFLYTHGMLDPWFRRFPLKNLKKSVYWRLAEHRVLRDARSVLFCSAEEESLAGQSFRPYQCRTAVTIPGTKGPVGDPAELRRRFLAEFPELSGKRLLLFVSRIHPKKGCDLLIEAFSAIAGDYPDLHLTLVGPDDMGWQEELQRLASARGVGHRVTWTGMIPVDLKWGAFHAADAFILPSHSENFGMVVVEALACSLPVLISNKVNIWREISSDRAGFVGPDDLPGTIALLRQWLSSSPRELAELRLRARRSFTERFHVRRATSQLVETLQANGIGN
jgi:glycosyltransferase involved in cell wall biosynthesis